MSFPLSVSKDRKPARSKRSAKPSQKNALRSRLRPQSAAPDPQPADASVLETLGAAISQPVRDAAADDNVERASPAAPQRQPSDADDR